MEPDSHHGADRPGDGAAAVWLPPQATSGTSNTPNKNSGKGAR